MIVDLAEERPAISM